MNLSAKYSSLIRRKLVTVLLVTASIAAFATLGDGGGRKGQKTDLSNIKLTTRPFCLRSGYNLKGNNLFNQKPKFIMLNTVVTYQKGNATYVLPLKKKVFLEKIKFNPAQPRF